MRFVWPLKSVIILPPTNKSHESEEEEECR